MFDRFTYRSRKVMTLANQEAIQLHHEHVGTEHVLLGLINEGEGVANAVLRKLNIDPVRVRLGIAKRCKDGGEKIVMGWLRRTPLVEQMMKSAIEEAQALNHDYVGTEHLLLGLVRDEDGIAGSVLRELGVEIESARRAVIVELESHKHGITPLERLWATAAQIATQGGVKPAQSGHMLLAMLRDHSTIAHKLLVSAGMTEQQVWDAMASGTET